MLRCLCPGEVSIFCLKTFGTPSCILECMLEALNTRQVRIHLINNSSAVRSLTLVIVQDSQLRGHGTGVWEPILWMC